jgi:very-short-patch-repair endonuclease
MRSVVEVVVQLGGWATAADLVKATSRRALAAALRRGDVIRLARGIYGHPALATDYGAAVSHHGVLSHTSAAAAWRLPLLVAPTVPHITVPTNRTARSTSKAVLHWADLPKDDLRRRLTNLERTVLDCARILPFEEALAVADAALRTGRLTTEELQAAAVKMQGPGRPNAVRVAAAADARAESFLESMARALFLEAGFEHFEPQVVIDLGGRRIRVDLGERGIRLAVEAEGYEHHAAPPQFAADCRRYNELVAAGWLVLRFTYQDIVLDPAGVVATTRAVRSQRLGVPTNG